MHPIVDIALIAVQAVLVIALADFIAGLIHWIEDAYFDENTPFIGSRIIRPNIVHHHVPRYFTQLSWWQSSRDLLLASLLLVAASIPLGFFGWQVVLFALVSTNANQVHKWAHRTRRENGRLISLLQDWRILQTPHHHGLHHTDPKNTYYCPVTNLVNPILERISFWQRLEAVIEKFTGIKHRDDTSIRGQGPGPDWLAHYRRPSSFLSLQETSSNVKASAKMVPKLRTCHYRPKATLPSTRGAASALTIVGLIIVGWAVGMCLQPLVESHRRDPQSSKHAETVVEKDSHHAVETDPDHGNLIETKEQSDD